MYQLTPEQDAELETLWTVIRNQLRQTFVAKIDVIDLLVVCVVAGEHLLLLGPPGTAKSALIQRFVRLIDASCFEYLLTRFTEPNELFGPVDIELYTSKKRYRRLTDGMLPDAHIVFLDEIFKGNSAILNTLLTVMNERVFYNGSDNGQPGMQPEPLPVLSVFGASNDLPDDPELQALVDRFAVRATTDNVPEEHTAAMLHKGWRLERERALFQDRDALKPLLNPDGIRQLTHLIGKVDTSDVREPLLRFVSMVRAQGFSLSDRRVVRLLRLAAASAILRRSSRCALADLWVLRHSWTHPQEAETIERIVREVAGDVALRDEERRSLEDLERDVRRQASLLTSRNTDAERLAALHTLNTLAGELETHPGDAERRRGLLDEIRMLTETLMSRMAATDREATHLRGDK